MNAAESEIRALAKKYKAAADKNTENAKLELAKGDVTRGKCCEARASAYIRCWSELCEIALSNAKSLPKPETVDQQDAGGDCPSAICSAWFGGVIRAGYTFENWKTIKIEQTDGYKVDLLLRFQEWVDSFGKAVTVRYWITDKPTTKEDAQEGFIRSLFGPIAAEMEANSYSYSEYSSGASYDAMLKIGGHDLMVELMGREGEYLWLEISLPNAELTRRADNNQPKGNQP